MPLQDYLIQAGRDKFLKEQNELKWSPKRSCFEPKIWLPFIVIFKAMNNFEGVKIEEFKWPGPPKKESFWT